jgi:hypothetical protein
MSKNYTFWQKQPGSFIWRPLNKNRVKVIENETYFLYFQKNHKSIVNDVDFFLIVDTKKHNS